MQRRVLLVHGDAAVQDLAARALIRIGVEVETQERGAGTAVDPATYAAVVIDLAVSDQLLDRIAAQPPPRPIVIVTAPLDQASGLNTEIVSLFVPAPYDPHTLVGVMLSCLTEPAN